MNINHSISNIRHTSKRRGALLLELLVVISLLAVILTIGSQAVLVSMQSGKISGDRDVAMGLAVEALEAVRSVADEKWQNIYGVTKGANYYATSTAPAGKWTLTSGTESIVINGITYTRTIVISDVSRDTTTREIQTTYVSNDDDHATQKATVTVSWTNADTVTMSEYFFRFKNKVCAQSAWTTGGSGNNVKTCPTTDYDTIDSTATTTGGLQLL